MEIEALCRNLNVVAALPEHALSLAPQLRPGDKAEIWAAAALNPLQGLQRSLHSSLHAWTWLVEGKPASMFGVGSDCLMSGIGVPWLLASIALDQAWPAFLKYCRCFLAVMQKSFPVLANWVDVRQHRAIAWLRWLGFTLHPVERYGPFGLPHHRFELRSGWGV